jgi:hypothetical protein
MTTRRKDESTITEITIQSDGRVYLFGASREVLEILEGLAPTDPTVRRVLDHVRQTAAPGPTPRGNEVTS